MVKAVVPLNDARAAVVWGRLAQRLNQFPEEMEKNNIVALNRVGVTANKEVLSLLTKRYTARRADIKQKINVSRATSAKPFVVLHGAGRPINLEKWPGRKTAVYSLNTRRKHFGWWPRLTMASRWPAVINCRF